MTMVCPFKLGASLIVLNAPRVHLQGRSAPDINIECIGEACAMFIKTDAETKKGACAPALSVKLQNDTAMLLQGLNAKIDAVVLAGVEGVESANGPVKQSVLMLIAAKLRALFVTPPAAPAEKPKLEAVKNEES